MIEPTIESQQEINFSVRRATRGDVKEIVRLLADDVLGNRREKYEIPLPKTYYLAFEQINHDANNELVVAEYDNEIVGTMQLTYVQYLTYQGGKRAQIEAVRVDEKYRNQGIGKRLIEWAIKRATEKECHLLQLTTDKERPEAQLFYERLGFAPSHSGMKLNLLQKSQNNDLEE